MDREPQQEAPVPPQPFPWATMAQGLALGVILFVVPQTKFILQVLITLIHELGHTAAAWAFGTPAIPALDFTHGGGITILQEQSWILLMLIYCAFVGTAARYRNQPRMLTLIGVAATVHFLCAITPLDDFIFVVMGHGMEFFFAAIFLYRGLTGAAVVHGVERPLYAAIGVYIPLANAELSLRLLTSSAEQAAYRAAKGHAIEMDFARLGDEFLHIGLSGVAALHLLLCASPFVLAGLAYLKRDRLPEALGRVLEE